MYRILLQIFIIESIFQYGKNCYPLIFYFQITIILTRINRYIKNEYIKPSNYDLSNL